MSLLVYLKVHSSDSVHVCVHNAWINSSVELPQSLIDSSKLSIAPVVENEDLAFQIFEFENLLIRSQLIIDHYDRLILFEVESHLLQDMLLPLLNLLVDLLIY